MDKNRFSKAEQLKYALREAISSNKIKIKLLHDSLIERNSSSMVMKTSSNYIL